MKGLKGLWLMLSIVLGLVSPGLAQEDRLKELEKKIDTLTEEMERMKVKETEKKIEALAEEIEKMKVFELIPELGKEGRFGLGPAASKVYGIGKGISLAGYGEVFGRFFDKHEQFNFNPSSATDTSTRLRDDSDMLRFVLYAGYKFTDRILFNSELEFEHAKTSAGPDTSAGEVAVEFAYLDFLIHPRFNIRGGLLLIPMGILNELHESPTYHGVFRTEVEQFIIPTTWRENGLGIFGEILPGLEYKLYTVASLVTNSRNPTGNATLRFTHDSGIRGGRQQGVRSIIEDRAFVARLDYRGIPGTLVGASLYTGKAHTPAGNNLPDTSVDITIWDLHLKAEYRGLEIRALYAEGDIDGAEEINRRANIRLAGDTTVDGRWSERSVGDESYGYYLEVAYDVVPLIRPGSTHYLAPFVRYEKFDTQDGVSPGYRDLAETEREIRTIGISYKPHPNINIKVDYQDRDDFLSDHFNIGLTWMF